MEVKKTIDNFYAYIYKDGGNPIRTKEDMLPDKKIECKCPNSKWQNRINKEIWGSEYSGKVKLGEKEESLIRKLLEFGGYEVCIPYGDEEDADAIINRGQLWYGDKIQMAKGEGCQCHRNSACLWEKNHKEKDIAIATGYALSEDGMWRCHTWCVLRKCRSVTILETTTKRVAYFGFVMTDEESEELSSYY